MIEQILIKRTLKAGSKIWVQGEIVSSPVPAILIEEVERNTGTVEVLKGGIENKTKLVFVAKRVNTSKATSTTTASTPSTTKSMPSKASGQRPSLKRRK